MIFIGALANNYNVLVGGKFARDVHLDLVIFLDVLHLRATLTNKVTVQRIPRALRQGASLRRGDTSQGRLRFLNLFSGSVNRDVVLLERLRVLGQIQSLDGAIHLHDVRDDLQSAPLTSQSPKTNFLISCSINFIVLRLASGVIDTFEHVVGVLLGVLLRNFLWNFLLVPERFGSWERLVI